MTKTKVITTLGVIMTGALSTLLADGLKNLKLLTTLKSITTSLKGLLLFNIQVPVYLALILVLLVLVVIYAVRLVKANSRQQQKTSELDIEIDKIKGYSSDVFDGVPYEWEWKINRERSSAKLTALISICPDCDEVFEGNLCFNCMNMYTAREIATGKNNSKIKDRIIRQAKQKTSLNIY